MSSNVARHRSRGQVKTIGSIAILTLAGAIACTSQSPPMDGGDTTADTTSGTGLDLRIVPMIDFYYAVRQRAALPTDTAVEPELTSAVTAARRLQDFFGGWGGWGPVDTLFLAADDLDQVRDDAAGLPDPMRMRDGREVGVREPLLALVAQLQAAEPWFAEQLWPSREQALRQALADLQRDFLPAHRQALAYMMESLDIADPGIAAPVFLVSETNAPGAFTFYLRGGAPASVVSVERGVDTMLFETVLHEATHVLDMASSDDSSVFVTLRSKLERQEPSVDDRLVHDAPHTLMFVQAGETVRRFYDPHHVDYGEVTTLYARSEPVASIERDVWVAYLSGEIARDEALDRIVARMLAAR